MSIATTDRKAGPFLGDDVTTVFPFDFKVYDREHLKVILTSVAGIETELTLNTDYTVSLNADQDSNPGGTVTYPVSGDPLATGEKLTIITDQPATQEAVLNNMGGFFPKTIEKRLDWLTILVQQLSEKVSRALTTGVSDSSTPDLDIGTAAQRASKYIKFDDDGDVELSAELGGTSLTQTLFDSFVGSVSAAAKQAFFDAISGVPAVEQALYKLVNPRTASEIAAGVTPVNYRYPELHAFRYMTSAQISDVLSFTYTEDVATALNNALSVSKASRRPVYAPAGGYLIGSSLILDDYMGFIGDGEFKTWLKLADGANCDVFITRDFAAFESNPNHAFLPRDFVLHGFAIDGNYDHNTSGSGIKIFGIAYDIRRVLVWECPDYGIYSNCERTYGVNVAATDEPGAMFEDYLDKIKIARCGLTGFRHKGPNDGRLGVMWLTMNGRKLDADDGYGAWISSAGWHAAFLHSYGNGQPNVFVDGSFEADTLWCRDGGKEGLIVAGNLRCGILFVNNNSLNDPGVYDSVRIEHSNDNFYVNIDQLFLWTENGGNGLVVKSHNVKIATFHIDGLRESAGTGIKLDGCQNFTGRGLIRRFSEPGGIGLHTIGAINCTVEAQIYSCETGWKYERSSGGESGNKFDLNFHTNGTSTLFDGNNTIPDTDFVCIRTQGSGPVGRARSKKVTGNIDMTTTGTLQLTVGHQLIHAPSLSNIQLTFIPPASPGVFAADWVANAQVEDVDETNITIRVNRSTASGTSGAAARIAVEASIGAG